MQEGTMDVTSYFNKLSLIWQGWTCVKRSSGIALVEVISTLKLRKLIVYMVFL